MPRVDASDMKTRVGRDREILAGSGFAGSTRIGDGGKIATVERGRMAFDIALS